MTPRPRTPRTRREPATPLPPELARLFERQLARFRQKFGREAGPNDPIFFDPDASEPRPLATDRVLTAVIQAMEQAGTDPALIYAFRKTGRIVPPGNVHLLSPKARAEWRAAVEEYRTGRRRQPKGPS